MPVEKQDLLKILRNYDIGKVSNIVLTSTGQVNDNWIVKTDKGKYILRKIALDRSVREVKFEFEFLEFLRKNNFSYQIPNPIKSKEGKELIKFGKGIFWLYTFIEGKSSQKLNLARMEEIAKMMAKIHKLTKGLVIKYKKNWPDPYTINWQISWLKKEMALAKRTNSRLSNILLERKPEIEKYYKMIKTSKKKLMYERLEKHVVHGDFNIENILFEGDKAVGLIDFDNCKSEPKIRDITAFILMELRIQKKRIDLKLARKFIQYYSKYYKLTNQEISFVPEILISDSIDYLIWDAHVLMRKPERSSISSIKGYFEITKWCDKNQDKILRALSLK